MSKCKKLASVILAMALTMAAVMTGCSNASANTSAAASTGSAASAAAGSQSTTGTAPGSMGKIAVIRNMINSDHTAQFFAGCTAEGKALGYTVDTFMSNGDDVKMQDLLEQTLQKDYKIWVVSSANAGYQADFVKRAVDKGIHVVCFDAGGDHVPGVTYTTQNDESLAQISLDAIIDKVQKDGKSLPAKIIEVNTLGAIVPFDTRHGVIQQYEKEGKVKVIKLVSPQLTGDYYTGVYNGISTALKTYGKGQIDGIWAASSTFLDAAVTALSDAKRDDVLMSGPDISNTEIKRLRTVPQYVCCASVDPYVIGIVNVRLAVLEALGVKTPATYSFNAVAVTGTQLQADDTMQTLGKYFKDFGASEEYNTQEIKDLRAKFASK